MSTSARQPALVIAEHDNASLKGSTLNTITAASQCGGEVRVLVADAAYFADGLAENVAEQVLALALATAYSHILAPATAYGKNILPRVAAKLDVGQIS